MLAPEGEALDEASKLVRENGGSTVVFDSLFIGCPEVFEIISSCRISTCVMLAHYLPSLNPLLTGKERKDWVSREQRFLKVMNGFLAPSKYMVRKLVCRGAPRGRIFLCPPGVDRSLLARQRKAKKKRGKSTGDESGGPVAILTVANWNPSKGLIWLLQILEELSDLNWEWNLVGDTKINPEYSGRFQSAVEASPVRGRVRIHGVRSPKDVRSFLKEADLFALASVSESYGMIFAEAQAAGVPVLANRVGGVPEAVVSGILCNPKNRKEWVRNSRELIQSKELRESMRRAAIAERGRFHSWEETAEVFLQSLRTMNQQTGEGV